MDFVNLQRQRTNHSLDWERIRQIYCSNNNIERKKRCETLCSMCMCEFSICHLHGVLFWYDALKYLAEDKYTNEWAKWTKPEWSWVRLREKLKCVFLCCVYICLLCVCVSLTLITFEAVISRTVLSERKWLDRLCSSQQQQQQSVGCEMRWIPLDYRVYWPMCTPNQTWLRQHCFSPFSPASLSADISTFTVFFLLLVMVIFRWLNSVVFSLNSVPKCCFGLFLLSIHEA